MRMSDHIELAWANLWKKRLRTFLTTSGVVIGVGSLVCMFAFGQGVQQNIRQQFNATGLFNYITVSVTDRGRFRPPGRDPDEQPATEQPPLRAGTASRQNAALDAKMVKEIMQIPGVEAVLPETRFPAQIRLGTHEQFTLVQVLPADTCQSGLVQFRAGEPYTSDDPNEMVISDSFLRRLGVQHPEVAVGKQVEVRTISLDFSIGNILKMVLAPRGQGLPLSSRAYPFRVAGVAGRMGFSGALPISSDVLIPPAPAAAMDKIELTSIWDFFGPSSRSGGYSTISVKVASPTDVPAVRDELNRRGLRTFSLIDQLKGMQIGFIIMDMFLLAVGMIGITVASLGIVNTMVMSILERYREIGIMKAVGATDGDVQKIFLFESGMIGLLGGLGGLVLAWLVSCLINAVVNAITSRQGVPYIHYFSFAWWLCLGAVLFSILVSLIAGIYPTFRAARVDPVVALRHD